jgi:hypothetical protein
MYMGDRKTQKTQLYLRKLEAKAYSRQEKEAVVRALEDDRHNFTSFLVCRDPVEKFLSVYSYLMDARVGEPACCSSGAAWPGPGQPPRHGGQGPGRLPEEDGPELARLPAPAGKQPEE